MKGSAGPQGGVFWRESWPALCWGKRSCPRRCRSSAHPQPGHHHQAGGPTGLGLLCCRAGPAGHSLGGPSGRSCAAARGFPPTFSASSIFISGLESWLPLIIGWNVGGGDVCERLRMVGPHMVLGLGGCRSRICPRRSEGHLCVSEYRAHPLHRGIHISPERGGAVPPCPNPILPLASWPSWPSCQGRKA